MGSLFKKPKAPPPISAPAAMPGVLEDVARAARRRKTAEMVTRSGRDSTKLSDTTSDTLG